MKKQKAMTVKELDGWFRDVCRKDDEKLQFAFTGLYDEIMMSADPERCTINHFYKEANAEWRAMTKEQKQALHDEVEEAFHEPVVYVLYKQLGFEVSMILAAAEDNIDSLKNRLRVEVQRHLDEYYDPDDEYGVAIKQQLLEELDENDMEWSDHDEDPTYELSYKIVKIPFLPFNIISGE